MKFMAMSAALTQIPMLLVMLTEAQSSLKSPTDRHAWRSCALTAAAALRAPERRGGGSAPRRRSALAAQAAVRLHGRAPPCDTGQLSLFALGQGQKAAAPYFSVAVTKRCCAGVKMPPGHAVLAW